jgi:hypothetical protein
LSVEYPDIILWETSDNHTFSNKSLYGAGLNGTGEDYYEDYDVSQYRDEPVRFEMEENFNHSQIIFVPVSANILQTTTYHP